MTITFNGVDLSHRITAFKCTLNKLRDDSNCFTAVSGNRHRHYLGTKRTLSLALEGLTADEYAAFKNAWATEVIAVAGGTEDGNYHSDDLPSECAYLNFGTGTMVYDISAVLEEV